MNSHLLFITELLKLPSISSMLDDTINHFHLTTLIIDVLPERISLFRFQPVKTEIRCFEQLQLGSQHYQVEYSGPSLDEEQHTTLHIALMTILRRYEQEHSTTHAELAEAALAYLPYPLFITGLDGTIQVINEKAREQLPPVVINATQLYEFYSLTTQNQFLLPIYKALQTEFQWTGEIPLLTQQREEENVFHVVQLLKDEAGQPVGVAVLLIPPVAEQQVHLEMARLQKTLDDKHQLFEHFLNNLSHEVRTPLNAIMGLNQLLLEKTTEERNRRYLQKIDTASRSLLKVVNQLLDYSYIENDAISLEKKPFNLYELMDKLTATLKPKADEKALSLNVDIQKNIVADLIGDPYKIEQVLQALLQNSLKFTDRGYIALHIHQDEGQLHFEVRDSGIGIDKGKIAFLLQPFTQQDMSSTRRFGGLGLGLTISQQLVKLLGGQLQIESEVGVGSIFSFSIPFTANMAVERQLYQPPESLRNLKVLVVDDSRTSRDIMMAMLTSFSFTVDTVGETDEALHLIQHAYKTKPYDLLLIDWRMPKSNGIEFLQHLQKMELLSPLTKSILVTAFGRESLMDQAILSGFDSFIMKPIHPAFLFETILDLFKEQLSDEELAEEHHHALQGQRVLVVEDNYFNQLIVKELLEGKGIFVSVAKTGVEAIEKVKTHSFDCILMDIQMPEMDGIAATKHIRTVLNDHTPIVAMTANVAPQDREAAFNAGMDDYLSKPIDQQQLWLVLQKWMTIKPLAQVEDMFFIAPPFIRWNEALARVNGNKGLLLQLLDQFFVKYKTMPTLLESYCQARQWQQLGQDVHMLKGVTGNLALVDLYPMFERWNEELKQHNYTTTTANITYFAQRFPIMKTEYEIWRQALPTPVATKTMINPKETVGESLVDIVQRITDVLKIGKVTQAKNLLQQLQQLELVAENEQCRTQLQALIKQYKLKEAYQIAQRWLEQLRIGKD